MELNNWTKDEIRRTKLAFMHMARHLMPGFMINDQNRQVINDLFCYFHRLEGGTLDVSKGLWLEGPVGTGKSSLMRIFSEHLRRYWNDETFRIYNCHDIVAQFSSKREGVDSLDQYTHNKFGYQPGRKVTMCFDEMGRESIPANSFGLKLNVMEYILYTRYSFFQQEGTLTHVTTNIDAEKTEVLYGDYIRDRRAEMFNIVAVTGESWRNHSKK